jgi:hypothetical protein
MKKILLLLALVSGSMLMTGCASIFCGTHESIHVTSDPTGAKFTVYNSKGDAVDNGTTPTTVTLERARGFFMPEKYRIAFNADGYYPGETKVGANLNLMYFGNIIFGGALGFVIVDPLTGAMWTLNPDQINYTLVSSATPLSPEELKIAQAKANPPKTFTNAPPATTGRR